MNDDDDGGDDDDGDDDNDYDGDDDDSDDDNDDDDDNDYDGVNDYDDDDDDDDILLNQCTQFRTVLSKAKYLSLNFRVLSERLIHIDILISFWNNA